MVSGHLDALEVVHTRATAAGALKVTPLAVSGAFHTPLMAPASERLMQVGQPPGSILDDVHTRRVE